jgi:uncharacterized protein (TIGR02996 family)
MALKREELYSHDPVELALIDRIRAEPEDDDARRSYAALLDRTERPIHADIVRTEIVAHRATQWEEMSPALSRLKAITRDIDPTFRAVVLGRHRHRRVEHCSQSPNGCGQLWRELAPTRCDRTRRCARCNHAVHYACWSDPIDEYRAAEDGIVLDVQWDGTKRFFIFGGVI